MKRGLGASALCFALGLTLVGIGGCRGQRVSTKAPQGEDEEKLVGVSNYTDQTGMSEEEALDERYGKREELPPRPEAKEKCTGKGKKRTCKMTDPDPKLSAAHGVRSFMGAFRWKMDPKAVMDQMAKVIEAEYQQKQTETSDAVQQDENRKLKREQIQQLGQSHVKFEKRAHHRWGVSLIQYDFEDDANEEMMWIKEPTLKKFYFFKDGELWKVAYAYSTQNFEEKTYPEILENKFKKWFGASPEEKVVADEKSGAPILRYHQWESRDGEIIRAFDMSEVHGVYMVTVVNAEAENYIGVRLPAIKHDEQYNEDVADVLGGSDVCYDEEGNMIEDTARCKEIRGF